jgi:hypothetical protein
MRRDDHCAAMVRAGPRRQILNTFNCEEVHGVKYLKFDMRLRCDTPEHSWYTMLATVGVIIYPIGIPAFFYGLMVRSQGMRKHCHPPPTTAAGALCNLCGARAEVLGVLLMAQRGGGRC